MNMEQLVEWKLARKPECSDKSRPSDTLPNTNLAWPEVGSNQDRRVWKPTVFKNKSMIMILVTAISSVIYCRVCECVTIDGVWSGHSIYWPLGTTSNYSAIANVHTLQNTTAPAKPFSSLLSVSLANHSTDFSIIIITRDWHNKPLSGHSVEWTLIPPPTIQI
jgi:hypothetical protein